MTQGCKSSGCDTLHPDEWMCYSVPFASKYVLFSLALHCPQLHDLLTYAL